MIYFSTQKGVNKADGEDAVLIGRKVFCETAMVLPIPEPGFICLSDGVGGNKGGRTAAHHILSFLGECDCSGADIKGNIIKANDSLMTMAASTYDMQDMATTLSGIWYSANACVLFHIGNTRVYVRQGKYLKQLTSDHTLYRWLMSIGRTDEAKNCNRNVIVGCLGGNRPDLISHLCATELDYATTYLLTSDGVHEYVTIGFLEEVLSSDIDNLKKCTVIIEEAKAAGSTDDMSVVLACSQEEQNQV